MAEKKKLIYMAVFSNKKYLELMSLLLATAKFYSNLEVDFLIMTSQDFREDVNTISKKLQIPLNIQIIDINILHGHAVFARCHIFDYKYIDLYDKILYLDTDITIQGDLTPVFELAVENKVYALDEGTIEHEFHGGQFFDFTKIDKNIQGINSGIILFMNTDKNKEIFNNIRNHLISYKAENKPWPMCIDQPFINYHFIKEGCVDYKIRKYSEIYCIDPPPPPTTPTDVVLCHFVWPLGNAAHKMNRMVSHVNHMLNNYLNVRHTYPAAENDLSGNYTWESDTISFNNGIVVTPWGNGSYTYLDKYTVIATWCNTTHFLRFNPTFTSFISLRKGDLNIVSGNLMEEGNLVYCCVFYNKDYVKLLNLLMVSMKFYSSRIDFLVLTSPNLEKEIKDLGERIGINIKTKTFNFTTIFQAACARLFIFEYEDLYKYNKILYLDTDIIIKGDLASVFAEPITNVLYAIQSGTIRSHSFGSQFFNFNHINQDTPGINSGTLLFNNCQEIRNLFNRINTHVKRYTEYNLPVPYTMDQPFINYHAIKDSMYNNTFLNSYVSLFEDSDNPENLSTAVICHFSYPIGNFGHKNARMVKYLTSLLLISTEYNEKLPIGKYTWNNGYISFTDNSTVVTSWGSGKYKQINSYTYEVSWNGYHHVLKMDKELTNYMSVRIKPADYETMEGTVWPKLT